MLSHSIFNRATKYIPFSPYLLCLLFAIVASIVSVNRYLQFEAGYYDFGIFDRTLWLLSRFKMPIIDHFVLTGRPIFADHLYPSLLIMAPLYWLTDMRTMWLVVQASFAALSGLVLYATAKHVLKRDVPAIAVMLTYYSFVGLQNAIITEFHELTLMTLPLSVLIYASVKENKRLFLLSFFWALGFKESTFMTLSPLMLFVMIRSPYLRRLAMVCGVIAVTWAAIAIYWIIPSFSPHGYIYAPTLPHSLFGVIKKLVDSQIKLSTLVTSSLSFGFTNLVTPTLWPTYIFHYLGRFTSASTTRHDLGLHYNAEISPIYALSMILFLSRLRNKKTMLISSLVIMTLAIGLMRFKTHGPLLLSINRAFYTHTKVFDYLERAIATVPENSNVLAHNSLAVRFTHHKDVRILRSTDQFAWADYIVIDTREGQNINNFLGIVNYDIHPIDLALQNSKTHRLFKQFQTAKVYKRV
jgi:uncharacterized membrane protein